MSTKKKKNMKTFATWVPAFVDASEIYNSGEHFRKCPTAVAEASGLLFFWNFYCPSSVFDLLIKQGLIKRLKKVKEFIEFLLILANILKLNCLQKTKILIDWFLHKKFE